MSNSTKDLKSLVKELALNQKRAGIDLETVPWQTKASIQNMKREAQEKLEALRVEYNRRVRANSLGLFVFGDPERVAAFTAIAAEEAGVLLIQADSVYQFLATKVLPSVGAGREFGPTQLQGLHEGLRQVAKDLEIRSMEMPKLTATQAVQDRDECLSYIRHLIRAVVGDDLIRLSVDRRVNELTLATGFSGNLLPVAVTGLEGDEIASLASLFTNTVTVEAGTASDGEVNKEYVLNRLASAKTKLKGKSN